MWREWSDAHKAKGHQGLPTTEPGRGRERFSPEPGREHGPIYTLVSGFWPPGLCRSNFVLFCGTFTTVALRNGHTRREPALEAWQSSSRQHCHLEINMGL